ncbi:hypothetical protein [Alloalcanivorax mobilis]|uniref:hypothetical protein n=1 Tax=Alloalcanivorax mobilis TaxID=2019569 RepID=UPI000C78CE51|nr:hypothetical protein [Alloalcanivorax mobilis]
MIGNGIAWGERGHTIIEEGELDRATLQLRVDHYLVAAPDGRPLPGRFTTLQAAKMFIETREQGAG